MKKKKLNISILRDYFGENKCSKKKVDLYCTYISAMEAHIVVNQKFTYYIFSAMEARIIVNQKFTNCIKIYR